MGFTHQDYGWVGPGAQGHGVQCGYHVNCEDLRVWAGGEKRHADEPEREESEEKAVRDGGL